MLQIFSIQIAKQTADESQNLIISCSEPIRFFDKCHNYYLQLFAFIRLTEKN